MLEDTRGAAFWTTRDRGWPVSQLSYYSSYESVRKWRKWMGVDGGNPMSRTGSPRLRFATVRDVQNGDSPLEKFTPFGDFRIFGARKILQ